MGSGTCSRDVIPSTRVGLVENGCAAGGWGLRHPCSAHNASPAHLAALFHRCCCMSTKPCTYPFNAQAFIIYPASIRLGREPGLVLLIFLIGARWVPLSLPGVQRGWVLGVLHRVLGVSHRVLGVLNWALGASCRQRRWPRLPEHSCPSAQMRLHQLCSHAPPAAVLPTEVPPRALLHTTH